MLIIPSALKIIKMDYESKGLFIDCENLEVIIKTKTSQNVWGILQLLYSCTPVGIPPRESLRENPKLLILLKKFPQNIQELLGFVHP